MVLIMPLPEGLTFAAQLMRDARYYGAVVVEEEGSMCAVVLATKLAEARLICNNHAMQPLTPSPCPMAFSGASHPPQPVGATPIDDVTCIHLAVHLYVLRTLCSSDRCLAPPSHGTAAAKT